VRGLRARAHPERLIRNLAQPDSSPLRGSLRLSKTLRVLSNSEFSLDEYPQIKKGPLSRTLFYLAHPERFELPTKWFEATYSIQLSYGCVRAAII
jgi:hypothetical protein